MTKKNWICTVDPCDPSSHAVLKSSWFCPRMGPKMSQIMGSMGGSITIIGLMHRSGSLGRRVGRRCGAWKHVLKQLQKTEVHPNWKHIYEKMKLKDRITPHGNFFQKDTKEKAKFNRKRQDEDGGGRCICMCMCTCMCVEHLTGCKTSDFFFSDAYLILVNLIPPTAQRRRWFEIVISGLIIPTHLRHFTLTGKRLNPRTSTSHLCGFTLRYFLMDYLYGFRSLNYRQNWASEKLHEMELRSSYMV